MSALALVCYTASVRTWHTVACRPNDQSKWQMPQKLAETEFVFTREIKEKRERGRERYVNKYISNSASASQPYPNS